MTSYAFIDMMHFIEYLKFLTLNYSFYLVDAMLASNLKFGIKPAWILLKLLQLKGIDRLLDR